MGATCGERPRPRNIPPEAVPFRLLLCGNTEAYILSNHAPLVAASPTGVGTGRASHSSVASRRQRNGSFSMNGLPAA